MFQKIIHFIKYHNAFTIILGLVLLLTAGAFASEDIRDAAIGEKVVMQEGIDNLLILAADLDNFDFQLIIKEVKEDAKNYYLGYDYQTLAIQENIWQNVLKNNTLTVPKAGLADEDLGLYAQEELGEILDRELRYLKEVQAIERSNGATQLTVSTDYTGLIGLVLDIKNKLFSGYEPVVQQRELPEISGSPTPQISGNQEVGLPDISSLTDVIVPDLPNSVIDRGPQTITTSTEVTFEFYSTKENSTFTCQIDTDMWAGCESPKTYSGLSVGFHQFRVQAIDEANQEEPSPSLFEWQIIAQTTIVETSTSTESTATSTPQ